MVNLLILGLRNDLSSQPKESLILGAGTTLGCSLLVTSTIIAHVLGDRVSLLELFSGALCLLFLCVTGMVVLSKGSSLSIFQSAEGVFYPSKVGGDMLPVGILTIMTAVVFLIDLVLLVRSTKFSLPK